MFRHDNTEGFTQSQLDVLNEAHAKLVALEYLPTEANDLLNNVWSANDAKNTVELLVQRVTNK